MSYSHADRRWAAWLHRSLESYRTPRLLVGTEGLHGAVPARMAPIFRDRDELSSSSDLGESIKEALADSESMIVICSPDSASSPWVNEEIRHFRSLGKGHRIYCVIVGGNPQSNEPEQACFAAAVLEGSGEHDAEPLAADVREWADGKSLAKLKIAAGILGVRLDELRRRDLLRKRKVQALAAVVIMASATLLLLTWQSKQAENEALLARQAQQASAEIMLAKFLEQSKRLGDMADLETRKAFGEVLSGYLTDLDTVDLTPESKRQLGVVLSENGVILLDAGHPEQAKDAFRNARQTLKSLVDESRGDLEALFELSQVEYWIGQVNLDLGEMQDAAGSFQAYADVSASLHQLEPENADWTMEVAYAQSNLGNIETRKIPSNPALVLQYFREALDYNELAASQDSSYASELAESHAYLADAWLGVCDIENAAASRLKNVELAEKFFNLDPGSNRLKQDYAYALTGLSRVQQMSGRVEPAMESLVKAIELQRELVEVDPSNMTKRWNLLRISTVQAQLLAWMGEREEGQRLSRSVLVEMVELTEQDHDIGIDQFITYGRFLRDLAHREFHQTKVATAEQHLLQAINLLAGIANAHPESKNAVSELFLSHYYYWDHSQARLSVSSAESWFKHVHRALNQSGCDDLNLATRLAVMEGRPDDARSFASSLIEKGYKEPGFMEFCAEHGLCTQPGRKLSSP
jgi:tetratricopeptide (TPR) repeat protein